MVYSERRSPPRSALIEGLESRRLLTVFGIDVSHWQSLINWPQVAAAGKEFVFMKATESVNYTDPRHVENMTNSRANGVLAGVYHFARPTQNTGAAEANHFVNVAGRYMKDGFLRPVLDLEDGASLGRTALSNWVKDFINTVRARTGGVEPLIYCNTNYASNYVDNTLENYDLWIANWGPNDGQYRPTPRPGTGVWDGRYDFWQYSSGGSVSGVNGNVDLDVFDLDRVTLERDFLVGGRLAPDRFEANDTRTAAADLGYVVNRQELNLSIHLPHNEDFFKFKPVATGQVTIDFAFNHAQGDVDVFLQNSAGTVVARSETNTSAERLSVAVTAGQTYYIRVIGFGGQRNPDYDMTIIAPSATVRGRHAFYNNSAFDGHDPAADVSDNSAIATDKQALRPGQAASIANYTSYTRGLNGIMIDVAGLPPGVTQLSRSGDFAFQVGNDPADPTAWPAAPSPSPITSIRRGGGVNGSDRVTIVWPDGAIRNQWLRVTMKATASTGLASPDVFYFGNAIGETGNDPQSATVDGADFAGTRDHVRGAANPAPVNWRWDFNRDRMVDGADLAIVRANVTSATNPGLNLLTAPAAAAVAPVYSSAVRQPSPRAAVVHMLREKIAATSATVDLPKDADVEGSRIAARLRSRFRR